MKFLLLPILLIPNLVFAEADTLTNLLSYASDVKFENDVLKALMMLAVVFQIFLLFKELGNGSELSDVLGPKKLFTIAVFWALARVFTGESGVGDFNFCKAANPDSKTNVALESSGSICGSKNLGSNITQNIAFGAYSIGMSISNFLTSRLDLSSKLDDGSEFYKKCAADKNNDPVQCMIKSASAKTPMIKTLATYIQKSCGNSAIKNARGGSDECIEYWDKKIILFNTGRIATEAEIITAYNDFIYKYGVNDDSTQRKDPDSIEGLFQGDDFEKAAETISETGSPIGAIKDSLLVLSSGDYSLIFLNMVYSLSDLFFKLAMTLVVYAQYIISVFGILVFPLVACFLPYDKARDNIFKSLKTFVTLGMLPFTIHIVKFMSAASISSIATNSQLGSAAEIFQNGIQSTSAGTTVVFICLQVLSIYLVIKSPTITKGLVDFNVGVLVDVAEGAGKAIGGTIAGLTGGAAIMGAGALMGAGGKIIGGAKNAFNSNKNNIGSGGSSFSEGDTSPIEKVRPNISPNKFSSSQESSYPRSTSSDPMSRPSQSSSDSPQLSANERMEIQRETDNVREAIRLQELKDQGKITNEEAKAQMDKFKEANGSSNPNGSDSAVVNLLSQILTALNGRALTSDITGVRNASSMLDEKTRIKDKDLSTALIGSGPKKEIAKQIIQARKEGDTEHEQILTEAFKKAPKNEKGSTHDIITKSIGGIVEGSVRAFSGDTDAIFKVFGEMGNVAKEISGASFRVGARASSAGGKMAINAAGTQLKKVVEYVKIKRDDQKMDDVIVDSLD